MPNTLRNSADSLALCVADLQCLLYRPLEIMIPQKSHSTGLHSIQQLLLLWCSQIRLPPQSLHWLLSRWCSQILAPPQSLHLLLSRWWTQIWLPPQSLHWLLFRWCSQIWLPPQSLHTLLSRWCSHLSPLAACLFNDGLNRSMKYCSLAVNSSRLAHG